jgi:hypothetical protein
VNRKYDAESAALRFSANFREPLAAAAIATQPNLIGRYGLGFALFASEHIQLTGKLVLRFCKMQIGLLQP